MTARILGIDRSTVKAGITTRRCATCASRTGYRCQVLQELVLPEDWCPDWRGLEPPAGVMSATSVNPPASVKPSPKKNRWKLRKWVCEQCGTRFTAKPTQSHGYVVNVNGREVWIPGGPTTRRFCGDPCYRAWQKKTGNNSGCFQPGHATWNKGMKGLQFEGSEVTQFKPGSKPHNIVPVGTVIERKQHCDNGRRQAFIKIGEPNIWKARALIVWEEHNGPLAKDLLLWHLDGNSLNDAIENLEAITRAENLRRINKKIDRKAVAAKIRATRRRNESSKIALCNMSVVKLLRLGYRYYCPVCNLPSKAKKLKCHWGTEALPL